MKKFTYLATMLLVMAGAVSCEKKAEVKEPTPQPTGVMRQVTISAGQAAEKTSVYKGNLTWTDGDKLSIVPTTGSFEAVALEMVSEPGGASATFQGSIDSGIADDTQLYGWAGGDWTYNSGTFTIDMPAEQTYVENGLAENAYPSIGTGTITGGIALSNPFGVLCLNVKEPGIPFFVKSITVTSAANNLAGEFTVNPGNYAVTGGSSKTLTLNCTETVELSADGVKFYIVVPAADYAKNNFIVTVTNIDGKTFNGTFGAITITAGSATTVDVVPTTGYEDRNEGDGTVKIKWVQLWDNGPKFAEYNVGSDINYTYEGYYAWGRSQSRVDGPIGGSDPLSGDTDTATKLWGNKWRMPTMNELQTLLNKCDAVWSDNYNGTGNAGKEFTGKDAGYTCNFVFFSAAGYWEYTKVNIAGVEGLYWTSTPIGSTRAYFMRFKSFNQSIDNNLRQGCPSVRAVLNE